MNRTDPTLSMALYGGSFDPVHAAHIKVAESALEQAGVDQIVFIPAASSPLKANTALAGPSDRIEMLRLALAHEPRFGIDTCEIERGGTSYTVETVKDFRRRFPDAALFWIIGADQLEQLPKWHAIEELASMVRFIVLGRPGYSLAAPAVDGLQLVEITAPLMPQSSSEIRTRLAEGRPTEDWLPASVEAFISARDLYTR